MARSDEKLPRLSPKESNVIRQLIERDKYGLELVAGSDGELSRNAVYVLLGRMEAKGYIEGRPEPTPPGAIGPPRRIYKVTGDGRRVLAAAETALRIWRGAL
jgi:DNA-binding PadR family transcriptional regulator